MDQIELRAWRTTTIIGVLAEEQAAPQPIEVDATLLVDLDDAGSTDDLTLTIDYSHLLDVFAKAAAERHILLEALALDLVHAALAFPTVDEAEVVVRKLRPPVPHDLAHAAVRIRRRRSDVPGAVDAPHEAIIALGSNLGERERYLRMAVDQLGASRRSQVWETEPVGGPDGQDRYLNMVVTIQTDLDPFALLRLCNRIERQADRLRDVKWGPRTLDLDILFYDDALITSNGLTIPHPRLAERSFVLAPLSEVAPERCPADWQSRLGTDGVRPIGPLR